MPVIGFVITTPGDSAPFLAAFRRGLGESGYVEGQNVAIEDRYAFNEVERLPDCLPSPRGRLRYADRLRRPRWRSGQR
jgi:hypothetical protein